MGNSKKEGKEMSAPQVMVTIPLEEKITEMDATSRDTGIEDASSDQISSRGSSDNDLKKLACEEERPSAFTLTFAFWWSRCQGPLDICRRYFKWLLLILYNGYLILGVHRTWSKTQSYGDGVKLLMIITVAAYLITFYYLFGKKYLVKPFFDGPVKQGREKLFSFELVRNYFNAVAWSIVIICIFAYSLYITSGNRYRLVSAAGILGFVFLGFLMSENKRAINWNQVLWGLFLQFSLALLVLRTQAGAALFDVFGSKITRFLDYTLNGSGFIFGHLATGVLNGTLDAISLSTNVINGTIDGLLMPSLLNGTVDGLPLPISVFNGTLDGTSQPIGVLNGTIHKIPLPHQVSIFAFKMLPVIIFFSFFVSILYYYGVMQILVIKAGWVLQKVIGTTAAESLNAAANIFLGMTEAPLVIKPYVPQMTNSELFAVMTGGFSTIAGSVLATYITFGVQASSLLAASVMAAPAALGYSKLFYPETQVSKTKAGELRLEISKERNALEAAGNGASQAIKICSNIAANLIAFLAFIKFLDELCMWLGSVVDCDFISFEWILSKLFVPIAFMMGVEWQDCGYVAKLIGLKTLVNEFVAYTELSNLIKAGAISKRSETIATFALCGFSNFSSIGITLGALGSMVPERKSDMASFALKSMIAGSTVTLTSACMAGLLAETS